MLLILLELLIIHFFSWQGEYRMSPITWLWIHALTPATDRDCPPEWARCALFLCLYLVNTPLASSQISSFSAFRRPPHRCPTPPARYNRLPGFRQRRNPLQLNLSSSSIGQTAMGINGGLYPDVAKKDATPNKLHRCKDIPACPWHPSQLPSP